MRIPIVSWPKEKTAEYMEHRVRIHRLPETKCSAEERWERPEKHAVYSGSSQRAKRVFDTALEANDYIANETSKGRKATLRVEIRKSESTRCAGNYCGVNKHCTQYTKMRHGL